MRIVAFPVVSPFSPFPPSFLPVATLLAALTLASTLYSPALPSLQSYSFVSALMLKGLDDGGEEAEKGGSEEVRPQERERRAEVLALLR
jgi:hypothetical protein